jgi:hypothetical protein
VDIALIHPAPTTTSEQKPKTLRIILIGLSIRLAGLLLIVLGDGHEHIFFKALVVIGVILSMGGIGVLKWLAMRPRRPAT